MATEIATLYGVPHSLYTGRARSYLIKAGIPYRERAPTSNHFREVVVPAAGGRLGLPTLEFPDGAVIRDGAAIIDHFEDASGHAFSPSSPRQNLISLLFDVLGAEGLLRPAMHYRWNFPERNLAFLEHHFRLLFPKGPAQADLARRAADSMRAATLAFGVAPDAREMVEAVYLDVLTALDVHFEQYPYLLGNRPCIGDFGMIAPLFAHLGRDPEPLAIMQARAPSLLRWVERMNRAEPDRVEFEDDDESWLANDAIPDTLSAVMKALAEDFVPETLAAAKCINQWLEAQEGLESGTEVQRGVGFGEFEVRGASVKALSQPYRFYLLARVQRAYTELDGEDREAMDALLAAVDMTPLLGATLARAIGRERNLEVWR